MLQLDPNKVMSLAIAKWLGIFAVACSLVALVVAFIQGAPAWCYFLLASVLAVAEALVILISVFEPSRRAAKSETNERG